MQGPPFAKSIDIFAKDFCNLEVVTSKKVFLDLNLHVLQFETFKLAKLVALYSKYKIAPLTPPIHYEYIRHTPTIERSLRLKENAFKCEGS